VVFYDAQGRPQAFGAETEDDEVMNSAETEGWRKAEWYVSHLFDACFACLNTPAGGSYTSDQLTFLSSKI
jgi:hypothetical protein